MATAIAAVPSFNYKGRDGAGKMVKGKIDASSEAVVTSRLRGMGISPISVTPAAAGTGLSREINIGSFKAAVGLKDLAVMSRQMATMISSGLSLLRTLTILAQQTENKALAKILTGIAKDVETGGSLSTSFNKHPEVFPPLMISLLRAGETGGFLDDSLMAVARNFESEVKLRQTIKSALTYPVIVLVMALLAVAGMLIFIVPIFKTMFEGFGGQLPLPTQILVVLSESMKFIAPVLVVGIVVFSVWWQRNKNTEKTRSVLDPIKLKLPVFGTLMRKIAIARFSRNFSSMLAAGVPILQVLQIVGETSGNMVVEKALRNIADGVRQGKSIAEPLSKEKVFPPMVTQMVSVGEDAGALEQMLEKIADFYDDEVQAVTEQLTALIEPLMIAFLGIVVGGMIVALYLPIFNIFTLIK